MMDLAAVQMDSDPRAVGSVVGDTGVTAGGSGTTATGQFVTEVTIR